jgi:hypothetical protein
MIVRGFARCALAVALFVPARTAIPAAEGVFSAARAPLGAQTRVADPGILALLPKVDGWKAADEPRSFFPEDLFEYINGAAESYLAYDFKELLVAEYARPGSGATLTVEIYDMATRDNAFGIFAAERYPENAPVDVGAAGYIEGEVLNFIADRYYVKLLAFDAGDGVKDVLTRFATRAAAGAPGGRALPESLGRLPASGRVARSERYIRLNFLGFEFLRDAWLAAYLADGGEYDAFFVPCASPAEAESCLQRLLDFYVREGTPVEKANGLWTVRNRQGRLLILGLTGRTICGASRVAEAGRPAAEVCVRALIAATSGAA